MQTCDLDENIDYSMYKKWIGIKIQKKKRQGAHKNEELCKKNDARLKRKRRHRKSMIEDVVTVNDYSGDDCKDIFGDDYTDHTSQLHIEEIKSLPTEEPRQVSSKISYFWKMLGYQ